MKKWRSKLSVLPPPPFSSRGPSLFPSQMQRSSNPNPLFPQRTVPDLTLHNQPHMFSNDINRNPRKRPFDNLELEGIATQQTEELNQMLRFHADEMRSVLVENRRRQMRSLVEMASAALSVRLKEKEREMERASRCNAELESRAAQLRSEAQLWQARTNAHEASAATLRVQLQQAVALCGMNEGGADARVEDDCSAFVDPDRVTCSSARAKAPVCRSCHVEVARVVFLPCRHLCLCPDCGVGAITCPVCFHVRSSSVEISFC